MNLYLVAYAHNDETCCFERRYTFFKKLDSNDILFDDLPPGMYAAGDSEEDANNSRVLAKLKSGKVLIGN